MVNVIPVAVNFFWLVVSEDMVVSPVMLSVAARAGEVKEHNTTVIATSRRKKLFLNETLKLIVHHYSAFYWHFSIR